MCGSPGGGSNSGPGKAGGFGWGGNWGGISAGANVGHTGPGGWGGIGGKGDPASKGFDPNSGSVGGSNVVAQKTSMGGTPKTAAVRSHAPVSKPRLKGVFGPMGIGAIKETDEGFTGSGLNPFDGAEISTSPDFGWDFSEGHITGSVVAKPNRGFGVFRDGLAKMFGRPYDRNITPNRARNELSKGKGALERTVSELGKGNRQYNGDDLEPDHVGIGIDVVSTLFNVLTGNVPGAMMSAPTTAITGINYAKDFGSSSTTSAPSTPTAQRTVSAHKSNPAAGMMGNDRVGRTLFASVTKQPGKDDDRKAAPVVSKGVPSRVRRGRKSLLLTGGRGVEDKANVLFTGLGRG